MNKKISLGAAIALILIAITVTFSITTIFTMRKFNDRMYSIREREAMYEKFAEVDKTVRQNYYGTINEDSLLDAVSAGYLKGIGDSDAVYYNSTQYSRLSSSDGERVTGIGVVVAADSSGYLTVTPVYSESPAATAGIELEDLIRKVGETDITSDNVEDMLESVNGEEGDKITIVIRRDNEDLPAMELTCRSLVVPTVSFRILEDNSGDRIGYIRIREFGTATSDQFSEAMSSVIGENVRALVLDVRENKGGSARAMSQILDRLLPSGDLYSVTYGDGTSKVMAVSDSESTNLPMTVLVNKRTTGYAELFAQIIKDYGKGQIIGEQTAGKGMLQEIFELSDGSAVSITIGTFNTPKNTQINKTGVQPDYQVSMEDILYEYIDSLELENDAQLMRALEIAESQIKALLIENGDDYYSEYEVSEESSEESSEAASEASEESADESADESDESAEGSAEDNDSSGGEDSAEDEASEDSKED